MAKLSVRFRVDFGRSCAIGPGKVALLEALPRTGSLSQAARELKISYRRAWVLLESLNTSFRMPVAEMSTGGRGGGGAKLTPFGSAGATAYRKLEAEFARRATSAMAGIARQVVGSTSATLARRPLQRSPAGSRRRPQRR